MLHVVVANDPWQKSGDRSVTPAHHRLAMSQLAFGDLDGVVVSDLEIRRGGPTYTIDTVAELERPESATVLVVGPAAARGVSSWHRADDLAERVSLAVLVPHGEPPVQVEGWHTEAVFMAPVEVSATQVRGLLAERHRRESPQQARPNSGAAAQKVVDLVPPAVMSYICEHNLYCR